MDFELTKEQTMVREQVRRFLDREIAPKADAWDREGPLPKPLAHELLRKLIPLGYVVAPVPKEHGGLGMDLVTYGVMMEELKRCYASVGSLVTITGSTARTLAMSAPEGVRRRYLPGLLSGDLIGATAITEPNVGSDVSSIETRAVRRKDGYVLNGTKMWITNGGFADLVVVVAQTDPKLGAKGVGRFLVDRKESPFRSREIPKVGLRSSSTAELHFEDCALPGDSLLTPPGRGFAGAMQGLELARANAALAAVGVAQAALDVSIRYVKERRQFGKAIGGFQLVQEMVADMEIETQASRLLAYRALSRIDRGLPAAVESSVAKAYATEAAVRVTSRAIQVHGAYGLSEEYPLERYFRDARCYTIPDGTTQIQKLIIGRELIGLKAFRGGEA